MERKILNTAFTFHGVGQGLFASGLLMRPGVTTAGFRWVYDCGTSSAAKPLDAAITRLALSDQGQTKPAKRTRLGLVVISHFDKDHISGIVSLLSQFTVDTLMIPYVPLAERLVAAFAEGVDTQQDLMRFFVNPVEYLSQRAGVEIGQVLLVPPSTGEGPADGETVPLPPADDGPWEADVEHVAPADTEQRVDLETFRLQKGNGIKAVEFLKPGSRIGVRRIWEFIPYNDPKVGPAPTKAFRNAVSARRDDLLSATDDRARARALSSLRGVYDDHFGTSSSARNEISLFLYTGPVPPLIPREILQVALLRGCGRRRTQIYSELVGTAARASVLYTGDGYVDTPARLNRLTRYLGRRRIRSTFCLQVMHHGARGNWHAGVAKRISPMVSVFSSDPVRKRPAHPDAEVLRDFHPFGAVQVDATSEFWWSTQVIHR